MSADRAGDDGGQHPIYDLCHLEFLDANDRPVPEGSPGRVIASRLYSAAMPILRYDLGDLAVIRGSTEPDGSRGYRIVEIHGRNSDIIQLPGGRWLSMPVINNILNAQLAVRQFKVVQEGRCFFRIYIAASPAGYASVEPALQSQFDELFHAPSRYQMSRVDAIPPDATGKIRTIARLEERNKTSNETTPS